MMMAKWQTKPYKQKLSRSTNSEQKREFRNKKQNKRSEKMWHKKKKTKTHRNNIGKISDDLDDELKWENCLQTVSLREEDEIFFFFFWLPLRKKTMIDFIWSDR